MTFRKLLILSAFVFSLMLPFAHANAQGSKIGVVNVDRVLAESNLGKVAAQKLEKEFAPKQKKIEEKGKKFEQLVKNYQRDEPTLSATQKQTRQQEIVKMEQELVKESQDLQNELNARRNKEFQSLLEKADAAIKQIASNEKYDLILTEAVFVKPEFDLTPKVLSILNSSK